MLALSTGCKHRVPVTVLIPQKVPTLIHPFPLRSALMPPTENEPVYVAVVADEITAYIIEHQLETKRSYLRNNNRKLDV
jgi:hypothetical protein